MNASNILYRRMNVNSKSYLGYLEESEKISDLNAGDRRSCPDDTIDDFVSDLRRGAIATAVLAVVDIADGTCQEKQRKVFIERRGMNCMIFIKHLRFNIIL